MSRTHSRVTIYDVARELGISPSTVTRALNNQTCISEATRTLVQQTAERMGYRKNLLAQGLRAPQVRIGLILRSKFPEYQNLIAAGARHACAALTDLRVSLDVCMLDIEDYDKRLAEKITEMADAGFDGVLFAPIDGTASPQIGALLAEKGIHAATLYHDLGMESVDFYVGADYRTSGRIAADLFAMSGLRQGDQVAIFTGFGAMSHQRLTWQGFQEMNERYGFSVRAFEHSNNEKIAWYVTEQLLAEQPNVKGIYCTTAVITPVCDRLIEAGRGDVAVIGTELLTGIVPYIENGSMRATIFQSPYKIGFLGIRTLYECITGKPPANRFIRINPQIVIRGNVAWYEKRITEIDPET